MKTTGLSFLEAVKALSDGKCEKIESPVGTQYCLKCGTVTLIGYGINYGIGLTPEDFCGEWKLIGVKQKFVIEGVGWKRDGNLGVIYPVSFSDMQDWRKFLNKPGMKMTLEWPE